MTQYLEDYKALLKRLSTIADEISYNVMVPFGSKAFFPGQLRHTNEGVYVLTFFLKLNLILITLQF